MVTAWVLVPPLGLLLAGAFVSEGVLHPPRRSLDASSTKRAQLLAESLGARMEDAEIPAADGAVLRGWLFRAAGDKRKAVIVLHGQADNRMGAIGYVPLFLKHGYDVLTPDLRAHGASGGDVATYGVKEADDVNRWAEWLSSRHSARCVFDLGESMGAGILLQALGKGSRFCAVVAESPFSTFREVAYDRLGQSFGCGSWLGRTLLRPVVESGFLYARLRYGVNLNLASAAKAVARTPVPVLLIHGTMDRNIPPAHSKRILRHAAGRVLLWEVPGAGHAGALAQAPGEFGRRVLEWFAAVPPFSPRHTRPNHDPLSRSSGKERDAETGPRLLRGKVPLRGVGTLDESAHDQRDEQASTESVEHIRW